MRTFIYVMLIYRFPSCPPLGLLASPITFTLQRANCRPARWDLLGNRTIRPMANDELPSPLDLTVCCVWKARPVAQFTVQLSTCAGLSQQVTHTTHTHAHTEQTRLRNKIKTSRKQKGKAASLQLLSLLLLTVPLPTCPAGRCFWRSFRTTFKWLRLRLLGPRFEYRVIESLSLWVFESLSSSVSASLKLWHNYCCCW